MNDAAFARSRPSFDLLVIAGTGLLGHALLLAGVALPDALLPIAVAIAFLCREPVRPAFDGLPTALIAAAGFAAIAYGCLATQDRSWDGFATWSLTARHLGAGASLAAPYFANDAVYHASPGYPLLQPILLQQTSAWLGEAGGRILFPSLWLALLFAVREPLLAMGVSRHLRGLTVAGLALVPLFTEPGHGSAESGFADLLLTLLVTHGAAAILLGRVPTAALVGLCLPLCKNEGAVHLAGLCVAATVFASWRAGLAMATGGALALAAWLPLQARLTHASPAAGTALLAASAALPLALAIWGMAVRTPRTRIAALGIGALAALGLPSLAAWAPASVGHTATSLVANLRGSAVGAVLGTVGSNLCWMRKLGGSFLVLAAAMAAVAMRRPPALAAATVTPLLAHIGLMLVAIVLFLLGQPSEQQALFLREGTVRYLSQLLGVTWLAIGLLLHRLVAAADEPRRV